MKVQVYTDPELIAEIQARSVRAPERDVDNVTCWREGSTEHYFIDGGYWYSLPLIPGKEPTYQPFGPEDFPGDFVGPLEPPEAKPGCGARLAGGQWWGFCGETDMGQTLPALCTECGGKYSRAY